MGTITKALSRKPEAILNQPLANTGAVSTAAFAAGVHHGRGGVSAKKWPALVMVAAFHGAGVFVKNKTYSSTAKALGDGLLGGVMANLGHSVGEKMASK